MTPCAFSAIRAVISPSLPFPKEPAFCFPCPRGSCVLLFSFPILHLLLSFPPSHSPGSPLPGLDYLYSAAPSLHFCLLNWTPPLLKECTLSPVPDEITYALLSPSQLLPKPPGGAMVLFSYPGFYSDYWLCFHTWRFRAGPPVRENMQHLSFWAQGTSLNMIFSSSSHLPAKFMISFFFTTE